MLLSSNIKCFKSFEFIIEKKEIAYWRVMMRIENLKPSEK